MLSLTKITRSEMGAYLCIASNGEFSIVLNQNNNYLFSQAYHLLLVNE